MKSDKVLVLGCGMLGLAFERNGFKVVGRSIFNYDGMEDEPEFQDWHVLFSQYDVVINCIGKSDTRWCEDPANFEELMEVNAELPMRLSRACDYANTKFVHISTGCLYDTRGKGKCHEDQFKSAHCNYVVSKWAGEGYLSHHDLIIRPRLIFDSDVAQGRNNLLQKLPDFPNYLDEFNSVTSCDTIVEAVEALVDADQEGAFNVSNTGTYTMWEMATALGYEGGMISEEELHESQGLFLVNNVMSTLKLEEFYTPRNTLEELARCEKLLREKI